MKPKYDDEKLLTNVYENFIKKINLSYVKYEFFDLSSNKKLIN